MRAPMPRTLPRPHAVGSSRRARRRLWRALLPAVAALALGVTACGGSDGPSAEETARHRRAVTELRSFGLTEQQAECVADRLGAETVVEAPGMDVLAAGKPYQDAAKACIG